MVTSAQFRTVQKRAFTERLSELGFGGTSTRLSRKLQEHDQLHTIEVQPVKYGHAFTVDLGLHFLTVPSLLAGETFEPEGVRGCAFTRRLFDSYSARFGYGPDESALSETLSCLSEQAAECLATMASFWANWPAAIQVISPDVLCSDAQLFSKALQDASATGRESTLAAMRVRQLFPGWYLHVHPTAIVMCYLSIRQGQPELMRKFLEVAISTCYTPAASGRSREIVAGLVEKARGSRDGI